MAVIHKNSSDTGLLARFMAFGAVFFFAVFIALIGNSPALAGATDEINDVAQNMVTSSEELPALVSAFGYLLGILLGVSALFKLKDHVDNPTQTPLRIAVVRFLAGGAFFALPIVYEATLNTIGNDGALSFDNNAIANDISSIIGGFTGGLGTNLNGILVSIRNSIDETPALIGAIAYLLGLIIGFQAIVKAKDHVENPDQTALRESVVRFLVAGALFAIPSIYNAMFNLVGGNGLGILGNLSSIVAGVGFLSSALTGVGNADCAGFGAFLPVTAGDALCAVVLNAGAFPAFLTAIGYLIGLILGLWGILKIRDHVLNPQQTGIWEGVSRLIAGGLFFALPIVVEVMRATLGTTALQVFANLPTTGFNTAGAPACGAGPLGLDGTLVCLMQDVMGPLHVVLNYAAFVAGMILLMIGVSRLIKSAQDGARGPGGIGTVMTFVAGAALISYNELVRAFSVSLGMANILVPTTLTFGSLQYTKGMAAAEVASANAVVAAIVQFVIIVGLISFVRGIFIIRGVAEGNQQSSVMAGVTHIIGGALAVNLGPLINAVQATLGLGAFGIAFGAAP